MRNFLEFEICIDFIFSNRDRHLTNISVLRDADTLNFISMAPIYDNGKSMFVGKEIGPITDKNMLSQEITSFRPTEYELLKYVQDKNLIDINKLPTLSEINELYHMDHKVSDQRINYTLQTYQKKVDLYDKFMRGQSLSSIKFGYDKGLASIIKE